MSEKNISIAAVHPDFILFQEKMLSAPSTAPSGPTGQTNETGSIELPEKLLSGRSRTLSLVSPVNTADSTVFHGLIPSPIDLSHLITIK